MCTFAGGGPGLLGRTRHPLWLQGAAGGCHRGAAAPPSQLHSPARPYTLTSAFAISNMVWCAIHTTAALLFFLNQPKEDHKAGLHRGSLPSHTGSTTLPDLPSRSGTITLPDLTPRFLLLVSATVFAVTPYILLHQLLSCNESKNKGSRLKCQKGHCHLAAAAPPSQLRSPARPYTWVSAPGISYSVCCQPLQSLVPITDFLVNVPETGPHF